MKFLKVLAAVLILCGFGTIFVGAGMIDQAWKVGTSIGLIGSGIFLTGIFVYKAFIDP